MNTDLEHEPVQFEGASNKKPTMGAADFRGKVPVALVFVGAPDEETDDIIKKLNASLIRFGERRVQLLIVVDGDPKVVSDRLVLNVPLVSDDGLALELSADRSDDDRVVSIILGTDGMALGAVRQLPADDQAAAILVAIDRLIEQFPDRFEVLPTRPSGDTTQTELVADPTTLIPDSEDPLA